MTPSISPPISVHPVRTEADFKAAVNRLYALAETDLVEGSAEDLEYDVLQTLADAYQKEHYPIGLPSPIEAIKFHLERLGYSESDLGKFLGGRSKKSEILSGKRKLSLAMIRRLSAALGISADILIQEY